MPDKQYVTRAGFVQFEPAIRDANGKKVTDVSIKTSEGTTFRITIWPELNPAEALGRPLQKGDWLAVDGAFTSNTYQVGDGSQKTSLQVSAYSLAVVAGVPRAERDVVSAPTSATTSDVVPF